LRQPERALEARDVRQQRALRHLHAVHHDLARHRRAQRQLAADLRRREALHAFFENKTPDLMLCSADLAQITNTSAIGAFEIHILLPEIR